MRISERFYGPALIATGPADLFVTKTVEGMTSLCVIRHIHLSNPSASPVDVTFSIGADAAGTRIFSGFSIPADSVYDHYGVYPMGTAEAFTASAGTNNILVVTISGDSMLDGSALD